MDTVMSDHMCACNHLPAFSAPVSGVGLRSAYQVCPSVLRAQHRHTLCGSAYCNSDSDSDYQVCPIACSAHSLSRRVSLSAVIGTFEPSSPASATVWNACNHPGDEQAQQLREGRHVERGVHT
eukprot:360723-Chlamydomonas_euryale.AAC.6